MNSAFRLLPVVAILLLAGCSSPAESAGPEPGTGGIEESTASSTPDEAASRPDPDSVCWQLPGADAAASLVAPISEVTAGKVGAEGDIESLSCGWSQDNQTAAQFIYDINPSNDCSTAFSAGEWTADDKGGFIGTKEFVDAEYGICDGQTIATLDIVDINGVIQSSTDSAGLGDILRSLISDRALISSIAP